MRATTTLWQDFKRQSIQEAVIQLMCREGLGSVTMERVAQEVGIAKGTVYLHYRDKQTLLEAVKDSALTPLMERLEQLFNSDLDPLRKLEAYSLRYLGYFDERRDLLAMADIVRVADDPIAHAATKQIGDRDAERLAFDVPERDIDRGDRRGQDALGREESTAIEQLPEVLDPRRVLAD